MAVDKFYQSRTNPTVLPTMYTWASIIYIYFKKPVRTEVADKPLQ